MSDKNPCASQPPPGLRARAESAAAVSPSRVAQMSGEEIQRLVHELQVHQIELSMQNEELIQAQQELARSRDRYAELYELGPLGYLTMDLELHVLEANLVAARLLGVERSILIGKRLFAFVASESQGDLHRHWLAAIGTPLHETSVLDMRRADGSTFRCRLHSVRSESASTGARLLRCALADVSDQADAEARERLQQRLAQAIADCAAGAIVATDAAGHVAFANREAERLFGYPASELLREPLHERLHGRYPDGRRFPARECPLCQSYLTGETVRNTEAVFFRKDGDPVEVACSCSALRVDGALKGAVLVIHDIQALKRTERELREIDRRRSEFLALLAHELRNPLAPIRNAIEICRVKGAADPTVSAAQAMIDRQLAHLVRLIDDLMDIGRLSRRSLKLRRERVDLAEVLTHALEWSGTSPECAGRRIDAGLPPAGTLVLEADPVRLAQVFSNLIHNACKFTPPEGRIRLSASREGAEAVASVEDSGVGLTPEQIERVFEMFAQAGATVDGRPGGLGIGLALSRALVELHGGTLGVESAGPGQGSRFSVRLPLPEAVPASPQVPDPTPRAPAEGRRILVADDNPDVVESMAMLLRLSGFEVKTAADGLQAVEIAGRWRPELVLLDLGMPRLDGNGACRQIRAEPWGRSMRIYALTGWGQEEDRRRSLEAGFDDHLVKPVDPAALLAAACSAPTGTGRRNGDPGSAAGPDPSGPPGPQG